MTGWPSTLTSFTDPLATQTLNSPSHSSIESAQNTGLEELQAFIGVNTGATASMVGSLLYDIKAPDSNGGGHIQTAVKGGTGLTAYTKGDLLVATSATALTKLAVGSDTQILASNSSVAAGVNWSNPTNNRITSNASTIGVATTETSIFSVTVPGSTLGTGNAVRTIAYMQNWITRTGVSVLAAVQYGGMTVASVMLTPQGGDSNGYGTMTHTMIANNSTALQRHFFEINLAMRASNNTTYPDAITFNVDNYSIAQPSVATVVKTLVSNISSINSTANQTLGLTVRNYAANASQTFSGVTVEKIV